MICGKTYAPDEVAYVCPDHGNDGILDVVYDYDAISAEFSKSDLAANRDESIWRYKPLLPVSAEAVVPPLAVGWTPIYNAPRMAAALGIEARLGQRRRSQSDCLIQRSRQRDGCRQSTGNRC